MALIRWLAWRARRPDGAIELCFDLGARLAHVCIEDAPALADRVLDAPWARTAGIVLGPLVVLGEAAREREDATCSSISISRAGRRASFWDSQGVFLRQKIERVPR